MSLRRPVMRLALLAVLVGAALPAGAEVPAAAAVHPAFAERSDPVLLAAWVRDSDDAAGRPFVIVDKVGAQVLAFDARGELVAQAPALLGMAAGDETPPGIGLMRLADIVPQLRITPAGRFEANLGTNLAGRRIVWIDYDSALSLHAVVTSNAKERRLERLATASTLDNRISYGCINVPARFFEDIVVPLFGAANGVVYILPEAEPANGRPAATN